MKNKTVSVSFMILGILFCICLVASNFLETKIIKIGSISLTGGLLIFPISYIINDCIAEVWGYKKARLIIWLGFIMNFFVIGFSQIVLLLPSPDYWKGEEAFRFVFGMAPRIAAASLAAFLVGSFLNAYVMSKMKLANKGKYFALRAVASTVVGESADSLIFFPLAFGGMIPFEELLKLMLFQVIAKTLYEIIILPLTIRIVRYIKKREETDVYDTNISYNAFKIKDL